MDLTVAVRMGVWSDVCECSFILKEEVLCLSLLPVDGVKPCGTHVDEESFPGRQINKNEDAWTLDDTDEHSLCPSLQFSI